MSKSRIGPFALEAPLSKGRTSGSVFRGVHLEQRKLAALRVFPIPMGLTPESRQAFASQLEQLKQLRHSGIVRCYGGGFDSRNAYLAYQLVEGESLDDMLARRERLPWETTFDFSRQVAEALQYAHQMGWIHGRLKPDKILISGDGTVKISDWRRDAISSMIGSGKPTPEQQRFMAPELLAGGQPDEKSDLYSVGALMFYMLTGEAPYADDHQDMKETVWHSPTPDVGARVMDCPVWLSAIVNQLLEKEPSKRPFSATALQLAFKEAQRRQSEGVGVLQHATAGFSPLQLKADRDEAEKVLGIKPSKKRKRSDDSSFFEQPWVLLIALLLVVAAIVWFLLPPSEETLRRRAEALLPPVSDQWQDWNKARDVYIQQIIQRFPEGSTSEWANDQLAWIDAREYERRLEREHRSNRSSGWNDADRQYWRAREYEQFGDLLSAMDKYRAIVTIFSNNANSASIVYLSNEGIDRIRRKGRNRSPLQEVVAEKLKEANQAYETARVVQAKVIWESIVELYSDNPQLGLQVAEAEARIKELHDR